MKASFKLKGSIFTLSVLELLDASLVRLDEDLANKVRLAPKFFNHTPVVIDVKNVEGELDVVGLRDLLIRHHLIPLGIRGAKEKHIPAIQDANLAVLTDHGELKNHAITAKEGVRVIKTPVRSGQQVYAQGDLIVIASVSRGAEVLAEGNIHVYGALRGRALAGVNGDKEAHIFCQQLDAELVAIAGEFKLFDENDAPVKKPSHITLDAQEKIVVSAINI